MSCNNRVGYDLQASCDGGNCTKVGDSDFANGEGAENNQQPDGTPSDNTPVGDDAHGGDGLLGNDGAAVGDEPGAGDDAISVAPTNTLLPEILGATVNGQTLNATTGGWTGTEPLTLTYQWQRCNAAGGACSVISGETAVTYLLITADVNQTLRVLVTATNAAGNAAATSLATALITDLVTPGAPVNTVLPTITGTFTDGELITANPGSWSGTAPITFTYQWQACDAVGSSCANLEGATASTYLLTASTIGITLKVVVTATNGVGSRAVASLATNVIGDTPPAVAEFDSPVLAIAVQGDRKRVVGGKFLKYGTATTPKLARLNTNGSLDTTFVQAGTGINGNANIPVNAIALDSTGKILAGGAFTSYNGVVRPYLLRLNTDGSLDLSFAATGTGLNDNVNAIAIDDSGKLVVGGAFTSYNSTSRAYVARLNSDGTLDSSFAPTGTGLNNNVNGLAIESSGKIIVVGDFTSYNGSAKPYMARLNTDGSLDATYTADGTGLNSFAYCVVLDASEKAVVGGWFTRYNGVAASTLLRFNSDGTRDTSFGTGGGTAAMVQAVALGSDGKLAIAGGFSDYDGIARQYVARVNSDGNLDTTFAPAGAGLNHVARSITFDGAHLLVGGDFTRYDGNTAGYFYEF